jgi:hypothetical protein
MINKNNFINACPVLRTEVHTDKQTGRSDIPETRHECLGGQNSGDESAGSYMHGNITRACWSAICNTCVDLNHNLYPEDELYLTKNSFSRSLHRQCMIRTTLHNLRQSSTAGCQTCILTFDGIR